MNPIRRLRYQVGISQQTLAERAGTSQPTIASYESGDKSPTLTTLQRLASALDLEVVMEFVPPLSREDRRSLAYHRAIAALLCHDPGLVLKRAQGSLKRLRRQHPHARDLLDRWRQWLALSHTELVSRILDVGMLARDMRQVTPFAGLLNPRERCSIIKELRKEDDEARRV